MARDPAVLFYTSDFLTGTSRLTDEQCGQYIRALCSQHQEGHFEKEELLQLLKSYDNRVWSKFVQDSEGKFYNERMDVEINKRIEFCNSRSHKGIAGRKPIKENNRTISIRKSIGNLIDNDNDNDNINAIEDKNFQYRPLSEKLKKRVLEHTQQKIEEQHLKAWDREVRLMVERDNRTLDQISALIDECHDMETSLSGFTWRNQILSMGKLREKWNEGRISIGMNKINKPQIGRPLYGRQEVSNEFLEEQARDFLERHKNDA
jgi:hypothetical protein